MRIPSVTRNHCVKALSQSMNNGTMTMLARRLIPNYDLYKRTGIPTSVAVPNQNAARQIIKDIIDENLFLEFVLLLIEFSEMGNGIAGRKIAIPYLKQIINGVYKLGYIYDQNNKIFIENPNERKTRNWGALKEGHEYMTTFLKIDIVGNTKIVRKNNTAAIKEAYNKLRDIFMFVSEKHNGRIWGFDGDGGIAAFCFGNISELAVLSGIEILHELFIYNNTVCPLEGGIKVRIAAHSGMFEYTSDSEAILNSETVKKVTDIEHKYAHINTMAISNSVKVMLETLTKKQFTEFKGSDKRSYFEYKVRFS